MSAITHLPLELGQVADPSARRAFEQVSVNWNRIGAAIARAQIVPIVTALPGVPFDGMTVDLQNAAMAAVGIRWRVVYRAASTLPHKWEVVGGAPWTAWAASVPVTATATDVPGTAFTLPCAGVFSVSLGASGSIASAGQYWNAHSMVATVASPNVFGVSYIANYSAAASVDNLQFTASLGDVARAQVAASAAGIIEWLTFTVMPLRVM